LRSLLAMTHFTRADWLGVLAAAAGSVLAVELSKWTWPQEGPEAERAGMAPAPPESRSDAQR
ncbi:MAG TPA: hypothetical protein PLW65_27055, partial [Pseudomonadota bacterium]|nr:hypothetical protein [Pseudomonadota bacterium]